MSPIFDYISCWKRDGACCHLTRAGSIVSFYAGAFKLAAYSLLKRRERNNDGLAAGDELEPKWRET
ncbi:hypothetical protein BTO30_11050 [Domibacillus antri]|uniref:Uncharacterized protein n=1 Tax=Domibacillus antri TaxID=1714264 RepID=A0A1Q8Q4M0_9BACI|nr:hypothetical protein BTO30_11050 [Domibacillus antri]